MTRSQASTVAVPLVPFCELVRVSSRGQSDKLTPEIQRGALDRLRLSRPGMLVERIEDGAAGLSGAKSLSERPDLKRLFALLASGEVKEVRVHALDRLSRSDDGIERATILESVKRAGAVIVDTSGTVTDPASQQGELIGSLGLLFASWDRAKIARNTIGGRKKSAAQGKPAQGQRPHGLTYSKAEGWQINEEAAQAIQTIFDLSDKGVGTDRIAEQLTEKGVPAPKANAWNKATVRTILRETAYYGTWTQRLVGEDYACTVPAIVTRAQWDRVQAGLKERTNHHGAPGTVDALIRGVAVCGSCGSSMHVSSKRDRVIYICAKAKIAQCENGITRAAEVDALVWSALVARLKDPDLFSDAAQETDAPSEVGTWESQAKACDKRIAELNLKVDLLLERRSRGRMTEDAYRAETNKIDTQIATLERSREVARQSIASHGQRSALRESLAETVTALRGKLDAADFATRRGLVLALVPRADGYRVEVCKGGEIVIHAAIAADPSGHHSESTSRSVTGTASTLALTIRARR